MALAYLRFHTDRHYSSIPVTPTTTDRVKNELDVVGNQVGFYLLDADVSESEEVAFCVEAHKAEFPKKAALALAIGVDVYYDDVNEEITDNANFRPVGFVIKAADASDTTVWIRFHQEAAGSTY